MMKVIKNIPLEFHPQAFVDENNIVVTIATFAEDATQEDFDAVLQQQKTFNPSIKTMISCCDFGQAGQGWKFTGVTFQPPQPFSSWKWVENEWGRGYWESPVAFPLDNQKIYYWNEEKQNWESDGSQI